MAYKKVVKKLLGELLLERGVITTEQLEEALAKHGESGKLLGSILVDMGYATESDIAAALAAQYGIPYLPLKQHEVDTELLTLLPREFALRYHCFPVDKIGGTLTIATDNPLDATVQKEISKTTGCKVIFFISTMSEIVTAIGEHYAKLMGKPTVTAAPLGAEEKEAIQVFQLEENGTSKE